MVSEGSEMVWLKQHASAVCWGECLDDICVYLSTAGQKPSIFLLFGKGFFFLSVEMRHYTLNVCATCMCGCTNTYLSPYCSSGLFAEFWEVSADRSGELPWEGLSHILRIHNSFPCSLNCEVEFSTLWISNNFVCGEQKKIIDRLNFCMYFVALYNISIGKYS